MGKKCYIINHVDKIMVMKMLLKCGASSNMVHIEKEDWLQIFLIVGHWDYELHLHHFPILRVPHTSQWNGRLWTEPYSWVGEIPNAFLNFVLLNIHFYWNYYDLHFYGIKKENLSKAYPFNLLLLK